jgi:PadR family transcriptional regulator PadR
MADQQRITRQTEQILETLMTDSAGEWSGSELSPVTGLQSGTIYPALLRMERFGWLAWRWEDIDPAVEGRPRKRLYRLTGLGEQVAREVERDAMLRRRQRERRRKKGVMGPGWLPT